MVLASARLRWIVVCAVVVAVLWIVLIVLLGIWRHDHVSQRHVSQASAGATLVARSNARVLSQRFETLRTLSAVISGLERLGRAAESFNLRSAETDREDWGSLLLESELVFLNKEFERIVGELNIEGIYLTNPTGYVMAASDWAVDLTHLQESFGNAGHFRDALEKGSGEQFGVDTVNGQPRFFFSSPIFFDARRQGVVVIATSPERIVPLLRRGDEDVLLSDQFGIVVASNNDDWMYRAIDDPQLSGMEVVELGLRYGRSEFLALPQSVQAQDLDAVVQVGKVHAAVAADEFVSHVVIPVDGLAALRRENIMLMGGLVLFGVLLVAVVALALAQIAAVRERAVRDPLTGLFNRRYMDETLPELIELDERGRIVGLSLVAFDLDRFKLVNDTWGHVAGDRVLRRFAEILADCSRRTDLPCRIGGEEFVVFLVEQDLDGVAIFAERVRSRVEAIDDLAPIPPGRITTSAGLVMRRPGENLEDMIKRADDLLYRAKENGRNRIECEDAISAARPADAAD
jgi:diguanylate cyclase (GGDEF)-like protein